MTLCPSCASPIAETDKYCNNCGLNVYYAENRTRKVAAIIAALSALIAAIPLSILKMILLQWLPCNLLPQSRLFDAFILSTCGVIYFPMIEDALTNLTFAFFIALAGALCGYIAAEIILHRSHPRPIPQIPRKIYAWGILAGVLFDLIFVFMILYPGQ